MWFFWLNHYSYDIKLVLILFSNGKKVAWWILYIKNTELENWEPKNGNLPNECMPWLCSSQCTLGWWFMWSEKVSKCRVTLTHYLAPRRQKLCLCSFISKPILKTTKSVCPLFHSFMTVFHPEQKKNPSGQHGIKPFCT